MKLTKGISCRVQPKNDVPFIVWLTAGMAAWFIFAEIVNGSAGLVVSNAHLIKKMIFHSRPAQLFPLSLVVFSFLTSCQELCNVA